MLKELPSACSVALPSSDIYDIILVFSRLEPLKSNILIILAHLAPQTVSGAELTRLLGYSQKARTIYRGVLDELEDDGYIRVNRQSNQYSIGIDQSHPIMMRLYELVVAEGEEYTDELLDMLEEM